MARNILGRLALTGILALAGCGNDSNSYLEKKDLCEELDRRLGVDANKSIRAQIPNPAAVYCDLAGGEPGLDGACVLPDGTEREQWDLYCSDCPDSMWCYFVDNPDAILVVD